MPEPAMDFKEFVEKLDNALAHFNDQGRTVEALSEKVAELQGKLLDSSARAMGEGRSLRLGQWDSEKQAGHFVEFCRSIFSHDAATVKTMTEGTDADGGYLVPEEFRPVLVRLIDSFGIIRQRATVFPMNREDMTMPSLSSGITVYWPGEAASITESNPGFGQVKISAKKMAALVPASSELLEDSSIAIANLLATLVAEAMAEEEDRVALVGGVDENSDPFDGILYSDNVNSLSMGTGDTTYAKVDADDLLDLADQVKSSAQRDAAYIMHRTVFSRIRRLKDSNGEYIFQRPTDGMPGTIWGWPFILSDVMPSTAKVDSTEAGTPFIAFGSLRHLYLGDRRRMSIARSDHAGFGSDLVYFRFIQRLGIKVAIPNAFAILKTAAA